MGDKFAASHNGIAKRAATRSARYGGRLTLQQALAIDPEDGGNDDLLEDDDNDLVGVSPRSPRPQGME